MSRVTSALIGALLLLLAGPASAYVWKCHTPQGDIWTSQPGASGDCEEYDEQYNPGAAPPATQSPPPQVAPRTAVVPSPPAVVVAPPPVVVAPPPPPPYVGPYLSAPYYYYPGYYGPGTYLAPPAFVYRYRR